MGQQRQFPLGPDPFEGPTLFIDTNLHRSHRGDPEPPRVLLRRTTPTGRLPVVAELTRDQAIGAAARLLECALRLPKGD